jgi:hypothetical protein
MDTGLNIRPVQAPSFASVRAESVPQRQAVRTDLPETQAVEAVAEIRPVTSGTDEQKQRLVADLNSAIDSRITAPRITAPTKRVDRDEASQELVFRTLNPETGYVVSQFPDDAILRQRAYSVQQRRAELEQSATQKIGSDA